TVRARCVWQVPVHRSCPGTPRQALEPEAPVRSPSCVRGLAERKRTSGSDRAVSLTAPAALELRVEVAASAPRADGAAPRGTCAHSSVDDRGRRGTRVAPDGEATSEEPMPRKQRFKPSRRPKP